MRSGGRAVSKAHPHIAIGRLWQESNTFAETRTTLADFERYTFKVGQAMLPGLTDVNDELAGFADELSARGANIVPLFAASTWCGGPSLPEVADVMTRTATEQLRAA